MDPLPRRVEEGPFRDDYTGHDEAEQLRRHRHIKRATCGFKWMVSQKVDLYWRLWFARMAREHDVSLVFLKRGNILRVWVSLVDKRRGTSIYEKTAAKRDMNIADGKRLLPVSRKFWPCLCCVCGDRLLCARSPAPCVAHVVSYRVGRARIVGSVSVLPGHVCRCG